MSVRFRERLLAALTIAGGVLACESPLSPRDSLALSVAEARWAARNFHNYEFEIRRACFCPPLLSEWSKVHVQGNIVTSVVVVATGEAVPESERAMFPTVDQVFGVIRSTASSDWAARIELEFDEVTGFPIRASFTSKPNIADAGGAYDLRNLVSLP